MQFRLRSLGWKIYLGVSEKKGALMYYKEPKIRYPKFSETPSRSHEKVHVWGQMSHKTMGKELLC